MGRGEEADGHSAVLFKVLSGARLHEIENRLLLSSLQHRCTSMVSLWVEQEGPGTKRHGVMLKAILLHCAESSQGIL